MNPIKEYFLSSSLSHPQVPISFASEILVFSLKLLRSTLHALNLTREMKEVALVVGASEVFMFLNTLLLGLFNFTLLGGFDDDGGDTDNNANLLRISSMPLE